MKETKWKNKNLRKATQCAFNGLRYATKTQRNIQIQLLFAILAIGMGIGFSITKIEWCLLILTIGFVLFAEIINTAIETTVDLCTEEYHPKAKIAKDIAAGAVVVSAICSVLVGIVIFADKIAAIL